MELRRSSQCSGPELRDQPQHRPSEHPKQWQSLCAPLVAGSRRLAVYRLHVFNRQRRDDHGNERAHGPVADCGRRGLYRTLYLPIDRGNDPYNRSVYTARSHRYAVRLWKLVGPGRGFALGPGGNASNNFRCGFRLGAGDRVRVAGQRLCPGGKLDEHAGGGHGAVHRHVRSGS